MSDITKKIFSIEPGMEAASDDVIRPVDGPSKSKEEVPAFVTREAKAPVILGTVAEITEVKSGWVMWTGLIFTLIWLVGAGLVFSERFLGEDTAFLELTGLILLLALPAALITLLWMALRRLVDVTNRNAHLANAAHALVTPETEALGRTQSLASGIRAEISKVNGQLADTVTALQGVQTAITRESQALDAAGLQLASRSEDVGRNLTLQRQALESLSGTFDAKMETLSAQIEETGKSLETSSESAKEKLDGAISTLRETTSGLSETTEATEQTLSEKITQLGEISRKIDDVSEALKSDLSESSATLKSSETELESHVQAIEVLTTSAQEKVDMLTGTLTSGQNTLRELENIAASRSNDVRGFYENLSAQLKQSEDDTLAAQGRTARMVEGNLAQMRREFSKMETELQTLQSRINNLRDTHEELPFEKAAASRLSLKPLDTDFPPVEPPDMKQSLRPSYSFDEPKADDTPPEEPLNLGADMQIENPDDAITGFDPEVLRRPGDISPSRTGFGHSKSKKDKPEGWRWRDMLGGLERPDADMEPVRQAPKDSINIQQRLDSIQLSPAAIVDDGTIINAAQARIGKGEAGLADAVADRLGDPIAHLQSRMDEDAELAADIVQFTSDFAERVGATPPTAPALRTVFGSPDGRAYLLCAGALRQ